MTDITSPLDTDKTLYVFREEIVAEFLKWIVRLHPETELPDLNAIAHKLQNWWGGVLNADSLGMAKMESKTLLKLCEQCTDTIVEIRDLNLSRSEREVGIAVDDPSRPAFVGSSRYDTLRPEHDFIDLDALARNVALEIIKNHP